MTIRPDERLDLFDYEDEQYRNSEAGCLRRKNKELTAEVVQLRLALASAVCRLDGHEPFEANEDLRALSRGEKPS